MKEQQARKPNFAVLAFASGLGSGYFPVASGTAGSAVAAAMYWFIPGFEQLPTITVVSVLFLLVGIPASGMMEKHYGNDPSVVVIDEFVGMWVALIALPKTIWILLAAFFLFRLFDIIKPEPARWFDNKQGGTGIMLDDVVAGIYANLLIQLAILIEPIRTILLS